MGKKVFFKLKNIIFNGSVTVKIALNYGGQDVKEIKFLRNAHYFQKFRGC